jgi:hypothetical protein
LNGPVVVGALAVVGVVVVVVDVVVVTAVVVGTAVVTDARNVVASVWFLTPEFCVQFVASPKPETSSQVISYRTSIVILVRAGVPPTLCTCGSTEHKLQHMFRYTFSLV